MPSFKGTYEHTVDQKGRLSIPTRMRDILNKEYGGGELYLTILEDCIEVYPLQEWNKKEEKLRLLPSRNREVLMFLRAQYSRACDCSMDRSGRILVPPHMRKKCEINSRVAIVGVMDHFEIWPLEKWMEKEREIEGSMSSLMEKVADYGV
ncbi:MAG: division/cell wall cluster transcriptional repressor MraZ [bacterium]